MPTAPRARVERRLARTARHGTGRLALALALALGAAAGEAARAVPSVDATARLAVSADVAPRALASRPGPARRSVVEVAASGIFDLFGFEVSGASARSPPPPHPEVASTPRRRKSTAVSIGDGSLARRTLRAPSRPERLTRPLAPPSPCPVDRAASATYDPLCEFINPLLDDFDKLDCGEAP
jgi:hypothetical protein